MRHIHTELKNWNFGIRKNVPKHRPRSMIKTPHLIVRMDFWNRYCIANEIRNFWMTWSWILNVEESLWKSVKIVDRFGIFHVGNPRTFGHPVSRYAKNSFRIWVESAHCI